MRLDEKLLFLRNPRGSIIKQFFLHGKYTYQLSRMYSPTPERRFYREHKLLTHLMSELEGLTAKTDFDDEQQVLKVTRKFEGLVSLLNGHAEHEDKVIHELLRQKGSVLHKETEGEHREQDASLKGLQEKLDAITECKDPRQRVRSGYEFYLAYRKFFGDNLLHLHYEESVLMPELQRLCTDEELRAVEWATYHKMDPQDMSHMLSILSPHMNRDDREYFITDMHKCTPDKFAQAWRGIAALLDSEERKELQARLGIRASE